MITELITDRTFLTDVSCDSWEELVDVAGAPLVVDGSVEPAYLQSIKDTVTKYGPYMVLVDDIVLLHGRSDSGVNHIAMSLALLSRPVYLQDRRITAAFLFAAVDHDSHLELLQELAHCLSDDELLELLRNHGSRDEVMGRFELAEEKNEVR